MAEFRALYPKVVLELTQALSSTLDLRSILFTVVQRIAEVARVDRCSIVLVHEGSSRGFVVAASDDRDVYDLPIDVSLYPEIQRVLQEQHDPGPLVGFNAHPGGFRSGPQEQGRWQRPEARSGIECDHT